MSGEINWWKPSSSTAYGPRTTSTDFAGMADDWAKSRGFWSTNNPTFFKSAQQTASVPSVNSQLSFTTGEQIGFASQAIGAVLGNVLANRQNKLQAGALREQAGLYDLSAQIQLQGAAMYAKQAAGAAGIGRMNARNLRLAAGQLDYYEQLRLREATLEARQRIGHGRVGFAGNGVLVDSGAAALWEQDEAADAALEKLDIMQQFEDRSWEYRTQANKAEAEGYAAAAQQAGQAAAAAGQAAALQAESARAQAARLRKKKSWGATIGTVLGGVIGGVATGGTGIAAGAALGGSLGGVYDASRN